MNHDAMRHDEGPASAGPSPWFYRSQPMSAGDIAPESQRVRDARRRAAERSSRQRGWFRPLGTGLVAIVVASIAAGHPAPGTHAAGLWLLVSVIVWVVALGVTMLPRAPGGAAELILIVLVAASGVAIAALQHRGATEIPASAAAWLAMLRLPRVTGIAVSAAAAAAVGLSLALAGSGSGTVVAALLLCALLAVMAQSMRLARENQDRAELLVAQLEDAREEQARAVAIAERGRIAGELHDLLAHSLSGAAIQLQGARKLAERERATAPVREAIDRGSELVRAGLIEARRAVAALRGSDLPGAGDVAALVDSFATDMHVRAQLRVDGIARPLPPDAGLAVYRAAQEALTNAARYAPDGEIEVALSYGAATTALSVRNRLAATPPRTDLAGVGGGHGLEGMRERVERLGGHMHAGPREGAWVVEVELPA